jgi:hypothetical protein
MILVLAVGCGSLSNAEPMGTAWTYQGRLMDANGQADGAYDFLFKLYNEPNGTGVYIPLSNNIHDIDVIDGYFTVELDFGQYAFNGDARWLEVAVRPGDSNDVHTILSPRQQVTPTPYAIRAHIADISVDGVTGSGTTNRLAKFTATKVVSDSAIYESGGNVGIGTTSPESRLHIEQIVGAWSEGIRLSYGAHDWDIVTDYGGERLTIAPDQNNTEGLVMRNGNVGIGTSSPNTKLHAVSDGAGACVYGRCDNEDGRGVHGHSDGGKGVYGDAGSDTGIGVYGRHNAGGNYGYLADIVYGVYGYSSSHRGVCGRSESGTGVYGTSNSGWAGYFVGDVYVSNDVSAFSFTDRTPYPPDLATAYQAVISMERLPDGQYDENNKQAQLDHSMLSDFIRSKDGNRDLSATVSCHNEVLKDLISKQEQLSKAHIYIEQLQKQNRILEERLVKLEAMIAQPAGR